MRAENEVVLADLSAATRSKLTALLPPEADPGNPVDVRGEATPQRIGAAVSAVLADPGVDGVLALHVPRAGRATGTDRRGGRGGGA